MEGKRNLHAWRYIVPPSPPAPRRAKFQNKLLYSASIGGGAHRAKPQSPHMYQAVRDPRSNLHFNACLSSIITSGTAWLNFTDAYRALASRRPSPSRTTSPSRLYALIPLPSLSLSLSLSFPGYLSLAHVRKPRFVPPSKSCSKKSRTDICGHGFNYIMYKKVYCIISKNHITFSNWTNCIMIDARQFHRFVLASN